MIKILSIVIPCHNEGEGLLELINTYAKLIGSRTDIEVVIVNDASKDNSNEILTEAANRHQFLTIVTNDVSQGYGNAILSGLTVGKGDYLGWTHGDSQTPPKDVFHALEILESHNHTVNLYLKGKRYGRPLVDQFFTIGMSVLETLLLHTPLWDINAQPNIFHRSFYESWKNPPKDFSFDLYAYYQAKHNKLTMKRFPVHFGKRKYGVSTWNTGMSARLKFIKRTLIFSKNLRKRLKTK